MLRRIIGNLYLLEREPSTAATQNMVPKVRAVDGALAPVLLALLPLLDNTSAAPRCNAEDLIQTVTRLVAPLANERYIRIVPHITPALVLPLPLHEAQQLLLHLIINRVEAIAPHDDHKHTLWISIVAWDATIVITVRDTGPSIPPTSRAHIFDLVVSTNAPITESGLGLALVRSILQRAGGNIALTDTRPGSTTFTAWLPRSSSDAPLGDILPPTAFPLDNHHTN